MKYLQILLMILTIQLLACKSQPNKVKNISVIELKERIEENQNIQILDVRSPNEWGEGIIKGALTVDVTAKNFEKEVVKVLNKNNEVYVYCRSGGRSIRAAEILKEKGYKPVNVLGGYTDWKIKVKK